MLILWSPAGLMRITTLFMCVWPIATCHKSPDHLLCGHISGTSTQLDFLCQFHPLRSAFQQVCPVHCSLDTSSTAHSDRLSSVGLALFLYGCECRKPLTKQHENHVWGFMIKITVSMSLFRSSCHTCTCCLSAAVCSRTSVFHLLFTHFRFMKSTWMGLKTWHVY